MENRAHGAWILSLALHFLLVQGVLWWPSTPRLPNPTAPVEIEILSEPSRTVVRDAPAPERLKDASPEETLAFLSKETQRVNKQLRALVSGMTANRGGASDSKKPSPKELQKFFEINRESLPTPTQSPNRPAGLSTVGDWLPDQIEVGDFTALNTDRYLFYSFYSRVEELIRGPWESRVRWALMNRPQDFNGSRRVWTTDVEVLLKPNGEYLNTLIFRESGIRSLDRAVVEAFARARLFPNPPAEMVDPDGLIRMKYRFHVRVDPRLLSRQ